MLLFHTEQCFHDAVSHLQVAALQAEAEEQEAEVARVEATTPADLYREDLQAFEDAMDERDEREAAENASLAAKQKRAGNNAGRGKGKAKVSNRDDQLHESSRS